MFRGLLCATLVVLCVFAVTAPTFAQEAALLGSGRRPTVQRITRKRKEDVARDLLAQSLTDGRERQTVMLEDGTVTDIAVGTVTSVLPTVDQTALLSDASRSVTLVHTHPAASPPSLGDVSLFDQFPGLSESVVITPDGTLYVLTRTGTAPVEPLVRAAYRESLRAAKLDRRSVTDAYLAMHVALSALDTLGAVQYTRVAPGRMDAARVTRAVPSVVRALRSLQ